MLEPVLMEVPPCAVGLQLPLAQPAIISCLQHQDESVAVTVAEPDEQSAGFMHAASCLMLHAAVDQAHGPGTRFGRTQLQLRLIKHALQVIATAHVVLTHPEALEHTTANITKTGISMVWTDRHADGATKSCVCCFFSSVPVFCLHSWSLSVRMNFLAVARPFLAVARPSPSFPAAT